MKKVVHLIDGRTQTGAISSVKRIIENFSYSDIELTLLAYGAPINFKPNNGNKVAYINLHFPDMLLNYILAPIKRIYLLFPLIFYFWVDIIHLGNYCKNNKIDVIHLHHFSDIFHFGFLRYWGIQPIASIRAIVNKKLFCGIAYKIFRFFTYMNCKKIIGISNATLDALNNQNSKKNVIIYNGIEGLDATYNPQLISETKGSYIVGSVIRFTKLKGIDFFFETMIEFYRCNPKTNIKFLLIAPAKDSKAKTVKNIYLNKLNKLDLIDKLIYFDGFPDYSYIMPYVDILFHTTLCREGFGNVVLEANWFGKPVVSTPCLGVNDIIVSETSGIILSDYSPLNACKKIENLYKNQKLYDSFSKEAYTIAHCNKFSISETVHSLYSVYMKL